MEIKAQGQRVAVAIGVVKWLIIGTVIVFGVLGILNIEFSANVSRFWELVMGFVVAWQCLGVWVVFGWFEHTLRNLVLIEQHTRQGAGWVTPGSVVDQQMRRTAGL